MHNVRFSEQHGYMIILCKAPLAQCLTLSKSSINAKKKKLLSFNCSVMSDSATPWNAVLPSPVLHHLPEFPQTQVQ